MPTIKQVQEAPAATEPESEKPADSFNKGTIKSKEEQQESDEVLKNANRSQAERCNKIAEQYLIQGEVFNAEKILQKGIRMCKTDRGIELLTEIVEGRDRERAAGRKYMGRRSAVDGAIRLMFGDSTVLKLDKDTIELIINVCQGSEEKAATLYADLSKQDNLTKEKATKIIQGMNAMWNYADKKKAHGHSHNGVPCGGHGHGSHVRSNSSGLEGGIIGMASLGGIIGLLAKQFGSRIPIVVILAPLGSMTCVLFTLAICYYLWRTGSNIRDPRVIFPAISELGASMPEQRFYQVGFAITGLLLALHIRLFSQLVLPKMLEHDTSTEIKNQAELAISWGYYSAVGVILQGVFTLEMKLSMQSMIHWGGAVLFMSGAMNHGK